MTRTRKQKGGVPPRNVVAAISGLTATAAALNPYTPSTYDVSTQHLSPPAQTNQPVPVLSTDSSDFIPEPAPFGLTPFDPTPFDPTQSKLFPPSHQYSEVELNDDDKDWAYSFFNKSHATPTDDETQRENLNRYLDPMYNFKTINEILIKTRAPPRCKHPLDAFRASIKEALQQLVVTYKELLKARKNEETNGSENDIKKDLIRVNELLSNTRASKACKPYLDDLRRELQAPLNLLIASIESMQKTIKDRVPE